MAEELRQDDRVASLETPLGKDKLVLSRFDATEGLSELFEFRIDALSMEENVDFDRILGRLCTVTMKFYQDQNRYFNGVATEAQTIGMRQDLYAYRLVLRPSLWLLTRTTNCRIWHKKTALEIVDDVLGQRGIDHRIAIGNRDFPQLDYTVQYRETDFAFACRLMEQHGIYYFFEHSDGQHTMVLANAMSSHKPAPKRETIRFIPVAAAGHIRDQSLYNWSSDRRFRTGKIKLRDYNFRQPNADMTSNVTGKEKYEKAQEFEFYDYPGEYDKKGDGDKYAKIRLEAEQALDHRRYAAGEAPSLFAGCLVTVQEHPVKDENKEYLLVRCTHHFATEQYRSAAGVSGMAERPYHGNYEILDSSSVYRAPMVTPKPLVYGPHTAKVMDRSGSDGNEIDVDDDGHGMIKVLFHWDIDKKLSCWIRVAQMWAGKKWGWQFIPRIGMEVVVEFLEGDPDRPLVVGAVYNGDNRYPYSLPDNKTQSGVKSDSSMGHNGYNEIMFEDKKMQELIRVHAEKDLDTTVLHAETRKIGERFEIPMGSPSRETTLLMGDDKLTIQSGNRQTSVAMQDKLTIGMSRTKQVGMSEDTTIGMSLSETVGMSHSTEVGMSQSVTVGMSQSNEVGMAQSHTIGMAQSTEAGMVVSVTAGMAIALTAGASSIIITDAGIAMIGPVAILPGPLAAIGLVVPPV